MDRAALQAAQNPLKERYREAPGEAVVTLRATGSLGEGITCSIDTGRALVEAGLHRRPAATGRACARATCCSRRWRPARA